VTDVEPYKAEVVDAVDAVVPVAGAYVLGSALLGGFDPATKKYVGAEAVVKAQIAQVQADKKMSAKEKKETLAELNEALKQPAPQIENKGNIDLVGKYYDKLAEALGGDDQ